MKLLLIEDNLALQTTLARTLERRGIQVAVCGDGAKAVQRWQASVPDVVALDLSLPGLDGLHVLAQARAIGLRTPVIILTARGTVGDRVLGLNAGADDYLPKPFDLDELEARIRALARRTPDDATATTAAFCGLRVDNATGAVYHHQQALDAPPRELAMLRALLARPGQAVAKEQLFTQVFQDQADAQPDAIEVVAYRLRKRLAATQARVVTLRGLGYLLRQEQD